MTKKLQKIVCLVIGILIIGAISAVVFMKTRFDVTENYSELKEEAYALYEQGKISDAIETLEAYCMYVVTDIDAKAVLGDWYYETGNQEDAYKQYYKTAESKRATEENVASLSVKNTSEIILEPLKEIKLEITPDVRMTKDMTLMITGHNIVPEQKNAGRIVLGEKILADEENYYTTEWFEVDPKGEYLTMSGGFNCAIWQFRDEYGTICAEAESTNEYRTTDTYSVNVYQMARAAIPEDAVQCRVTYFDRKKEAITASPYEELTIVYGRLPGESKVADFSYYEIPDLKEGEKIVLDKSGWTMVTTDGTLALEDWKTPSIEKGSYIKIGGKLPGRVSFNNSVKSSFAKEGIYTIRFDSMSSSAMGERMDDAKNLGFNSAVGNGTIALGENHFDNIYPWKDMKLCAIKNGKITYAGDANFALDGSSGDVFVEIPKFYVKRSVDERYDSISISGVKHDGFELDPAFVTKNGETDKIYVAAYLTAKGNSDELISASGVVPVLDLSPEKIKEKTAEKGKGFYEMDYAALAAVQKLFMVETGLRNSQYLYLGTCAYSIASAEEDGDYSLAISSNNNTNCINVTSEHNFVQGNNVIIFNSQNYEESYEKALQDVRQVKVVRDNPDGTQAVYFTGDPIKIESGVSAIAHVSTNNGSTRNVAAHTGAVSTERGTVSFKYRNIENLWGNAYVYIDGVTVNNGVATLTDRKGNKFNLAYNLPVGETSNPVNSMVRRLGYDVNHPTVMLPSEASGEATISTFYGDAYISGDGSEEYVLYYGGGWNSRACAGLFAFAANATKDENHTNTTGRMMYINE